MTASRNELAPGKQVLLPVMVTHDGGSAVMLPCGREVALSPEDVAALSPAGVTPVMIESAAQAIAPEVWATDVSVFGSENSNARKGHEHCKEIVRSQAKAALTAVLRQAEVSPSPEREPSEAMLNAARDWSRSKYGQPIGNDAAKGCWQAMFDALRQEPISPSPGAPSEPVAWALFAENGNCRIWFGRDRQDWAKRYAESEGVALTPLYATPSREADSSAVPAAGRENVIEECAKVAEARAEAYRKGPHNGPTLDSLTHQERCDDYALACETVADAIRAISQRSVAETDPALTIPVPLSALHWLFGEGPDAHGYHFDPEDRYAGGGRVKPYWWRSHFRKLIGTPIPPATPSKDTTA